MIALYNGRKDVARDEAPSYQANFPSHLISRLLSNDYLLWNSTLTTSHFYKKGMY